MCRATAAVASGKSSEFAAELGIPAESYKRTSTNVVPIRVIWSKLLEVARLHDVHPCRHLQLSRPLQMGSVCNDESVRANKRSPIDVMRIAKSTRKAGPLASVSHHIIEETSAPNVSYSRHCTVVYTPFRSQARTEESNVSCAVVRP